MQKTFARAKSTHLGWHICCGQLEMEELLGQRALFQLANTHRHYLFLKIRHPRAEFYHGGWGTELLYYEDLGEVWGKLGRVWCTDLRASEIQHWFIDRPWNYSHRPNHASF